MTLHSLNFVIPGWVLRKNVVNRVSSLFQHWQKMLTKPGFALEGGFPRSDAEWCHVLSRQTMLGSLVYCLAISGPMWPS